MSSAFTTASVRKRRGEAGLGATREFAGRGGDLGASGLDTGALQVPVQLFPPQQSLGERRGNLRGGFLRLRHRHSSRLRGDLAVAREPRRQILSRTTLFVFIIHMPVSTAYGQA